MGCILELRIWGELKNHRLGRVADSALCQVLYLSEDPQTKSPVSATQLTVHLGRDTQGCLTSNINMAKH